jgi:hypothetical protein
MEQFIKTSIEKIRGAIDNNKLVIFVGAGVSVNSNCPPWSKLVDKFADELGIAEDDRNKSIEYFLKIPQYYFIERGEKEYFDIIDKIFNGNEHLPNNIHNLIFELNPSCVVTTNFDDLLEMTVKSNGLFYTTIKQDSDLPYCINDKLIIKMHGDSNLKNIVLKEEDYLSYSRKFPLIENYMKALFSTKTILFVGYSAEDPDFKLLFQWVKDELDGHFQPAYLLETDKQEDRIKFNYYKNRGINILYYDDIKKEIDKVVKVTEEVTIKDPRGIKLYNFLKYIKDYSDNPDSFIDSVYNKLSIFDEMNALTPDDIIKVINVSCIYDFYAEQELRIYNCNELSEIINKIKIYGTEDDRQKYKIELMERNNTIKLLNILTKAGIKSVSISESNNTLSFEKDLNYYTEYEMDTFNKLLVEYKYDELKDKLKCYLLDKQIEGNEGNFLKKAYFLYKVGKYLESYEILKSLSIYAFSKRKYLYYFIALFNIKHLKPIINHDYDLKDKCTETYDRIIREINSFDIEQKYMELPQQYKDKIFFITKLFSFNYFYKCANDLEEKTKSLYNQKKTIENGGFSFNNDVIIAFHMIRNILIYIRDNYIMVEHFSEIKNLFNSYVECILINYSINSEKSKSVFNVGINKVNHIDKFTLDIIIDFVDSKKLLEFINKYEVKELNIIDEDKTYLCEIMNNIQHLKRPLKNYNWDINYLNRIIDNLLIIFKHTTVTKEMFAKLINMFETMINKCVLDYSNYNNLLDFIIITANNNKDQVDSDKLISLMNAYIVKLVNKKCNGIDVIIIDNNRFFGNLVGICKLLDSNVQFYDDTFIKMLVSEIEIVVDDGKSIDEYYLNVIKNIIFCIYPMMEDDVKRNVEQLAIKVIKLIDSSKDKFRYIDYMYKAIMSSVIITEGIEYEKFIVAIDEYIKNAKCIKDDANNCKTTNEHEIKLGTRDFSEDCMVYLLNLILSKKIYYEDIENLIPNVISNFLMIQFFTNKQAFDYSSFESEWLKYLNIEEIRKLLNIPAARKKIHELILCELEKDNKKCILREQYRSVLKIILEDYK